MILYCNLASLGYFSSFQEFKLLSKEVEERIDPWGPLILI